MTDQRDDIPPDDDLPFFVDDPAAADGPVFAAHPFPAADTVPAPEGESTWPAARGAGDPLRPAPTWSAPVALAPPRAAPAEPAVPCDLGAERSVLAACMNDTNAAGLATGIVRSKDFYDPRHRAVYDAIVALSQFGKHTDLLSVYLKVEQDAPDVGVEMAWLAEVSTQIGSIRSVETHAKRIARLASVQRILRVAHGVGAEGHKRGIDPDDFFLQAEKSLGDALQDTIQGESILVGDVIQGVYQTLMDARANGGALTGIATGFRDLDKKTLGLHGGALFILAARPGMGKTALALNIALNVALTERRPPTLPTERPHVGGRNCVMVFSMEMRHEELIQRLLAARARVNLRDMAMNFNENDEIELRNATNELSELRFYIDDTAGLTPVDVRARARRVAMQNGQLDLIIVDYLQLMSGTGGKTQNREQAISEISRSLKGLAKELNVTVIALSQLNRGVESRSDKRPLMSDLRESGAIEQDADVIAAIYRESQYAEKDKVGTNPNLAELILLKQRAGETGTVLLHWDGKYTRFSNFDNRMSDPYVGM